MYLIKYKLNHYYDKFRVIIHLAYELDNPVYTKVDLVVRGSHGEDT